MRPRQYARKARGFKTPRQMEVHFTREAPVVINVETPESVVVNVTKPAKALRTKDDQRLDAYMAKAACARYEVASGDPCAHAKAWASVNAQPGGPIDLAVSLSRKLANRRANL